MGLVASAVLTRLNRRIPGQPPAPAPAAPVSCPAPIAARGARLLPATAGGGPDVLPPWSVLAPSAAQAPSPPKPAAPGRARLRRRRGPRQRLSRHRPGPSSASCRLLRRRHDRCAPAVYIRLERRLRLARPSGNCALAQRRCVLPGPGSFRRHRRPPAAAAPPEPATPGRTKAQRRKEPRHVRLPPNFDRSCCTLPTKCRRARAKCCSSSWCRIPSHALYARCCGM